MLFCLTSGPLFAAPEEIQVYMDEMNKPGEIGLDIHNTYVVSGSSNPDYPGAQAPAKVLRVTPEFSYGLTPNLELGGYILTSHTTDDRNTVDGEKVRLKFLASKTDDQLYFWGVNLEVGRVAYRLNENPWNAELKGIFGYRNQRWTVATNPNIAWKISGPALSPTNFHLDSKIAYKTDFDVDLALESYNEFGPIHHMGHFDQLSQTVFAVAGFDIQGWEFNLGVGRGLTTVSDRWLVKAIVSVPF